MDFMFKNNEGFSDLQESSNARQIFEEYLKKWKLFLASIFICLVIAVVYNLMATPRYSVSASILIKETEEKSSFEAMSTIEDFGFLGLGTNTLENEIQILKSRRLLTNVVKELNLNTTFYKSESFSDREIYPNVPFLIEFSGDSVARDKLSSTFYLTVESKTNFSLEQFDGRKISSLKFNEPFRVNVGNDEIDNFQTIAISLDPMVTEGIVGEEFTVVFSPINRIVDYYLENIIIEPVTTGVSDVIAFSLTESVREKGIAIINNLIEQYNADGNLDKALIAQTTTNFLDERLDIVSKELVAIDASAAQFKMSKGLIDSNVEANYYLESSTSTEADVVSANLQLQLVNHMLERLESSSLTNPLPGNIGLADPTIVNLTNEYNELILQRNRILKSSSTRNPIIVSIDSQLEILKNNLKNSLIELKSTAEFQIISLNQRSGQISSKIASAPQFEKEFKDIIREQETKNSLYLLLLQKREESILSTAVQVNKAKIIDPAYSSTDPISPKKKLILVFAVVMGIIIPIVFMYVQELFDTKVRKESDLEMLNLPFLGEIPMTNGEELAKISEHGDSNMAEAFRFIRTSLNFMLDGNDQCKTIMVTSTRSGEGKTFTAINLANSIALTGKKTLLLGMDLRAPAIDEVEDEENYKGISNYIIDDRLTIQDVISKSKTFENLDFIQAGNIPPNPVELLMNSRVRDLFSFAKSEYDYIIIDTSPIGMVADAITLEKYSDIVVYVIRANYLDKRMLHIPKKLNKTGKLKNMTIVMNGLNLENHKYGYGYGYSNKKKRKWYHKFMKSTAVL
jgi:capsular exopolysaccharide synthesis family protein